MTARLDAATRKRRLVNALEQHGPGTLEELMDAARLTVNQFGRAWADVKRDYAADAGKVAVYDPVTGMYGLWDAGPEAYNGALNRLADVLTRLLTIEKSVLDGLLAQRIITPRLWRGLVMARDEYAEQADRLTQAMDDDIEWVT